MRFISTLVSHLLCPQAQEFSSSKLQSEGGVGDKPVLDVSWFTQNESGDILAIDKILF